MIPEGTPIFIRLGLSAVWCPGVVLGPSHLALVYERDYYKVNVNPEELRNLYPSMATPSNFDLDVSREQFRTEEEHAKALLTT